MVRTSWSLAGLCAAAALVAPPLSAQVSQDTVSLPEVTVTATRVPIAPDAVTSTVTVLKGEDLRARGIRFVAQALRTVPGAAVVPTGSYGGATSLFLRGGESDYVKVMVDGVPVNQSGGAYNFANLTTANLDRIEIVRGPASVLYGSDAVAGVVQLFTRRGAGPLALTGRAEAGTFGTVNWSTQLTGGTERVGYSASVSRFSTDGILRFNNEYRNTVGSGAIRIRPDDRTDAALSVRYSDNRYDFPTDFAGVPSDSNQFNFQEAVTVGLDAGRRLSDRVEVRLALGLTDVDGGSDDRPDHAADTAGFGFASHRDIEASRRSLDGRVNIFPTGDVILTGGVQLEREAERQHGETSSNFGGGIVTAPDTPFDRSRTTWGSYAQAVADLASGLALNLNARFDHSVFGDFVTYRAGAAYRVAQGTRFRASLGRGFKAPTFCEQFCDAPFIVGDSTLEPERSFTWEAAVEQDLFGGRLSLSAAYFDQTFKDLVLFGPAAPGEPNYFNGAAADARGVELGARAVLLPELEASVAYTYLHTRATDDAGMPSPSFAAGEPLIRRPVHSGSVSLRYGVGGRASLTATVNYVGRREDVDFGTSERVELSPYATLDAAASVDLTGPRAGQVGVALTLRAENLLDTDYTTVVGFPGRDRAVFAGVEIRVR